MPTSPSVTLTDAGIRLTILPNTWSGYPSDLARYYTPVEIKIENDRKDEIQVRYADFLAMDEAQNQYRAVAPSEVARALFGERRPYGDPRQIPAVRAVPDGPLLAWHDPWWPSPFWSHRFWPPISSPFYPYSYYDPGYPYRWSRSGYDILTLGLREGRILPGARVEGFLYLQLATQKGSLLTVSWRPATAEGKALGTLSSQFRILR